MSAQTAGEEIKQLGRESEKEGERETERTLLEIHKFSESFFFFFAFSHRPRQACQTKPRLPPANFISVAEQG